MKYHYNIPTLYYYIHLCKQFLNPHEFTSVNNSNGNNSSNSSSSVICINMRFFSNVGLLL